MRSYNRVKEFQHSSQSVALGNIEMVNFEKYLDNAAGYLRTPVVVVWYIAVVVEILSRFEIIYNKRRSLISLR